MSIRQRRHFSLAVAMLVPLIISPALLGVREAYNFAARRPTSDGEAIWFIGIGFAYALIITLFWYRRNKCLGVFNTARLFRWCLLRGAFCGAFFGALLFLPAVVTQGVVEAQSMKANGLVSVIQPDGSVDWEAEFRHLVFEMAKWAAFLLLVFTLNGGLAGCVLGLLLPRLKAT